MYIYTLDIPVYPTGLPKISSFSLKPNPSRAVTSEDEQPALLRRRARITGAVISVSWQFFSDADINQFRSFCDNTLDRGSRWFIMWTPLNDREQVYGGIVRFRDGQPPDERRGFNYFTVSAELDLHDRTMNAIAPA